MWLNLMWARALYTRVRMTVVSWLFGAETKPLNSPVGREQWRCMNIPAMISFCVNRSVRCTCHSEPSTYETFNSWPRSTCFRTAWCMYKEPCFIPVLWTKWNIRIIRPLAYDPVRRLFWVYLKAKGRLRGHNHCCCSASQHVVLHFVNCWSIT